MATKKKQGAVRKAAAKVKSKAKSAVKKVAAKATRSLDRAAIRAAQAPAKKATRPTAAKASAAKASPAKAPAAKASPAKASPAKASPAKPTLPAPKISPVTKAPAAAKPSSMAKAPAVTAAVQRAAAVKSAPAKLNDAAPAQKSLFGSEPAPAPRVTVGQPAPALSLPGDDGKTHSLSEHLGKPVVIYFYPKDNTPGCTQQACDFRDNLARAQGKGAVVFGISRDSLSSHEKFRTKFQLNFPLLSDESLEAHRAFGTWGAKSLYGRQFDGTIRSTFLIDRQGKIARVWPKVSVTGHVDEVLSAIEALA